MNGNELPGGLGQEERFLTCPCGPCTRRRGRDTSAGSRGRRKRRKLVAEFRRRESSAAFGRKCSDHSVRSWKSVESAANEFGKTKSPEAAERMYRAIYAESKRREEASDRTYNEVLGRIDLCNFFLGGLVCPRSAGV